MALTWRNVTVLTSAALRDRNDPRPGTGSIMQSSQHKMVTLVNGKVVGRGIHASVLQALTGTQVIS
jgi:hypothetical protein